MKLIPRFLAPQVDADTPPLAVAIFGPRRIGKTTMLEEIVKSRNARWYVGDEPESISALNFQSLSDVRNALLAYDTIVIDEAHKLPNIGNTVKMMVDVNEHLDKPARIFITSSSPFYLSTVKESALGRVVSRQMWPLSLQELAASCGWGSIMNNLAHHIVYGLMPNAYSTPSDARRFLSDYCSGLLLRDLLDDTKVRRPDKLRELLVRIALYVGSEVNYDNLARECNINRLTVEDYVAKLEQASIIRVCPSYSRNLANELKKGKKIYIFDNGIRNALIQNFAPLAERSDAGALWENFFFMERIKQHDIERDFSRMFFWRTTGNAPSEIDFIEELDQKLCAFECKLSDKTKRSRGAALFSKTYPNAPITVVHPSDCPTVFALPTSKVKL